MKTPTEFQLDRLMHAYDPSKAHDYYEKHKKLKGRQSAAAQISLIPTKPVVASKDPRAGKTKAEISKQARATQRKKLSASIQGLEQRLHKLEAMITKRLHEEASEDRKGKAKKERSAKESAKPATAAEKAKQARENKKYQDKNQQKIKSQAKKNSDSSSGDSSSSKTASTSKHSASELQSLATKVKGQISVAKQKLAAL